MKKIFSILSLVLMFACCNFALTSCGDDDDDEETGNKIDNRLVGSWKNTTSIEGLDFEYEYTFNADGTFFYGIKYNHILSFILTDEEGYLVKEKGTYTVSKDILTIKTEYGYYVTSDKPNAEWEKTNHTETLTIEWVEDGTTFRVHWDNGDGEPSTSADYKKVK